MKTADYWVNYLPRTFNKKGIGEKIMNKFCKYEVGKRYSELRTSVDGVQFDINDSTSVLVFKYNKPSAKELKAFESSNSFEIRSITLNAVSYILVKMGGLEWVDAPYTPHLSLDLTHLPNLKDNKKMGLGLLILLIDTSTGEVCKMRMVGLGNRFSQLLIKDVEELSQLSFDTTLYHMSIRNTYSKYTTSALVKLASNYYKLTN